MLDLLSNGFRVTALFLLISFGIVFYLNEVESFKKNIFLMFLLTLVGYLLAYWQPVQSTQVLFNVSFSLSVSLPFFFWLLSKSLFDDDFVWSKKLWILTIAVPIIHNLLYHFNEGIELEFYRHFKIIPYLFSVLFIMLVIYETVKNKENDLVLSRLKKRNIFVIFSSFLALFSVYFFFVQDPIKLPGIFELIQNITICIFIFLFFSSQFDYNILFIPNTNGRDESPVKAKVEIHKRIIEKLIPIFENEKYFTNERITVAQLASVLNEKEYLLRQAINGELGYTNFNNFLNHYRINEACRLIKENQYKELTFQEIAFKMGYQSVATFNRAFKKETEQTPTEYARYCD